jgi:hypothetical protein
VAIYITIENKSLRCLERARWRRQAVSVSGGRWRNLIDLRKLRSHGLDSGRVREHEQLENESMDWTAVQFDEVMGELVLRETTWTGQRSVQ